MRQPTVRTAGTYVFSTFRLAADGTSLLREGTPVQLPPKVIQTLLALVRRAGDVVTKSELLDEVWPDSFVEETGVARNISMLRRALERDGDAITTVARIGYRFDSPVVYEAQRSTPSTSIGTSVARGQERQALFVGRDAEFAALLKAFISAERGMGRLVSVTGEAGIGKSTIVEHFLGAVRSRCHAGRGRSSRRFSNAEPHLPLLEALQELTGSDARFVATLRRIAPTWSLSVLPSFAGDHPGVDRQARSAERLLHELTVFLHELSQVTPIVVVLEDVHWSDVSTVDVLAHLAARIRRSRLLVVLTYRPAELKSTGHPFSQLSGELLGRGELEEIALPLLALPQVRSYVSGTLHDEAVAEDAAALVYRRTEGNPLFMVDLVRYLQEQARTTGFHQIGQEIPASLRSLIAHALELLPDDVRSVLAVGAIEGYEFDSLIVAEVTGRDPARVEELLRSADRIHGLLTAKGEQALPDGRLSVRYRFVHVLYQEAVYASIVPSTRMQVSRRVAESLLGAFGSTAHAIAGHAAVLFEAGRDLWRASEYFLAASRNAAARFAFHEAATLSASGLQCLGQVSAEDPTLRLRRETDLTFARFIALASLEGQGSGQLEGLMRRLVLLSEQTGDLSTTAAALSAQWTVHMARGECASARRAAERLEGLAAASCNEALLMSTQMQVQIACHHLGEFQEAEQYNERIVAASAKLTPAERLLSVYDPVVASLAESSRNSWIVGKLKRAEEHSAAGVALALQLRHPDSLAFAYLFSGWVCGYRHDWDAALAAADAGIAVAESAGAVQTLAWNLCVRGWVLAHLGRLDEGVSELARAIESSRRIFGWVAMPQFSAMMAESLLLRGEVSLAESWLVEARDFMDSHGDSYFSAEVHRLIGRCAVARGDQEGGEGHIRRAVDVARAQGATMFELRAAVELTGHLPDEGRQALRQAISVFPEPSDWPDVVRARSLMV